MWILKTFKTRERMNNFINKNKNKIYKWNKRKFLKNMFYLLAYILINGMFAINILYLFGIDIIK